MSLPCEVVGIMRASALGISASIVLSVASVANAGGADTAGDPVMGKRQFAVCTSCHTVEPGGADRLGPNLNGIFGKQAGSKAGFAYSNVIKNAGIIWDERRIDQYITNPAQYLPGNKMAFPGVARPDMRANIIAYLKEATRPK